MGTSKKATVLSSAMGERHVIPGDRLEVCERALTLFMHHSKGGNAGSGRLTGGAGLLSNQQTTEYEQVVILRCEQLHVNTDE